MIKIVRGDLSEWVDKKGAKAVETAILEDLDKKPEERTKQPEDYSFQELARAFGNGKDRIREGAVVSTAFPKITEVLISKTFIKSYDDVKKVGDELTTRMPSRKRSETLVGLNALPMPEETGENMPYQTVGFSEKYVTTKTAKEGYIIDITKDTITFDETNLILQQAKSVGKRVALEKEEVILQGIQDLLTKVWRPSGTATALYSGANKNIKASNALVDWTNIDASDQQLATITDEAGKKIMSEPTTLLVPSALRAKAMMIVNSTETRYIDGKITTVSPGSPVSGYKVFSSRLLANSTTWYFGDFKEQFVWQEIWPLATKQIRSDERKDILYSYLSNYYGGIAARDKVYVCKNTA